MIRKYKDIEGQLVQEEERQGERREREREKNTKKKKLDSVWAAVKPIPYINHIMSWTSWDGHSPLLLALLVLCIFVILRVLSQQEPDRALGLESGLVRERKPSKIPMKCRWLWAWRNKNSKEKSKELHNSKLALDPRYSRFPQRLRQQHSRSDGSEYSRGRLDEREAGWDGG